jgi:hypothetical protein
MAIKLSDRQKEIIVRLYGEAAAHSLVQRISSERLSFAEIEKVSLRINEEFLMHGLGLNYEPNEYGLELDALLDTVSRPRLRRGADQGGEAG